jgi:hypothetical protein
MNRLLITVAAAALIAGTTFASAQPGQGGSPGAAERSGSGTMERSNGGQGTGGQGAVERGPAREGAPQQRTGQSREQRPAPMRDQNQGQAPRQSDQGQMQQGQERQGTTQREGTTQRQGAGQREGTGQRGQAEQGRTGQSGRAETTGRAPADVQITSEQRTQIRQRLGDNASARIDRSKVNFSLSVGVTVPRTVRVFDLPAEIVTIVPAYRGYKYVIVEDEILIIDPRTLRIVYVIEA